MVPWTVRLVVFISDPVGQRKWVVRLTCYLVRFFLPRSAKLYQIVGRFFFFQPCIPLSSRCTGFPLRRYQTIADSERTLHCSRSRIDFHRLDWTETEGVRKLFSPAFDFVSQFLVGHGNGNELRGEERRPKGKSVSTGHRFIVGFLSRRSDLRWRSPTIRKRKENTKRVIFWSRPRAAILSFGRGRRNEKKTSELNGRTGRAEGNRKMGMHIHSSDISKWEPARSPKKTERKRKIMSERRGTSCHGKKNTCPPPPRHWPYLIFRVSSLRKKTFVKKALYLRNERWTRLWSLAGLCSISLGLHLSLVLRVF